MGLIGEKTNEKYIDYFKLAKKKIHKIERSLGDLNGFVEHLEEYGIAGRIYATNVMDAGLVKNQSIFKDAYDMGYKGKQKLIEEIISKIERTKFRIDEKGNSIVYGW